MPEAFSTKFIIRCRSECFEAQNSMEKEIKGYILCSRGLDVGMAGGFTTLKKDR